MPWPRPCAVPVKSAAPSSPPPPPPICVFLPIVFVEGVAGQLFRDQALTVTYSLVASLVVALMLIPMLSSLSLERMISEADETGPKRGVKGPALFIDLIRTAARGVGRVFSVLLFPPVLALRPRL